jgi:hypothetical protein
LPSAEQRIGFPSIRWASSPSGGDLVPIQWASSPSSGPRHRDHGVGRQTLWRRPSVLSSHENDRQFCPPSLRQFAQDGHRWRSSCSGALPRPTMCQAGGHGERPQGLDGTGRKRPRSLLGAADLIGENPTHPISRIFPNAGARRYFRGAITVGGSHTRKPSWPTVQLERQRINRAWSRERLGAGPCRSRRSRVIASCARYRFANSHRTGRAGDLRAPERPPDQVRRPRCAGPGAPTQVRRPRCAGQGAPAKVRRV